MKPYTAWYTVNGIWACASCIFLVYYSYKQLKNNYQTKRAIAITYGIESGYLILSIWAWLILGKHGSEKECNGDVNGIQELLVDMVILLYMRSLRLLSIVLFIVICGPLLLICWYKNRPAPTENPEELIKNLIKLQVPDFKALRAMNYRHAPTPTNNSVADASFEHAAPTPMSSQSGQSDFNGIHTQMNPYENE